MKNLITCAILCIALSQYVARAAEESAPEGKKAPLTRHEAMLTTVTATVEAIDLKTREVTLKGPLGNSITFTADKRIQRLDEVKVGDLVRAHYFVSVAAELREPTAEEQKHPLTVEEVTGKAPMHESPAAAAAHQYKVVTTIEGLDRTTQTVTVKGPRGHYLTARVEDPSNLTKMRIGENIVVTYTEALAISLEKVEPPKKD